MVSRRDALSAALVAGSGLAVTPSSAAERPVNSGVNNILASGAEILRGGTLMNLARAYRVMEEEKLDGLVMALPTNVYHLTGYWDHVSIRHDAPNSIVLLSRDPKQAPGLVMGQFLYYYSFSDAPTEAPLQTFLFTGWDGRVADLIGATRAPDAKAVGAMIFEDLKQAPLGDLEQRRRVKLKASMDKRPLEASAERALAKAAKEMGLDKGRIGYDHAIVAGSYEMAGLPATMVYADRTIRRIRMVKSPRELELMKLAIRANAEAALAAAKTARAGATHRELRAAFWTECAKRGTDAMFMQLDGIIPETDNREFKNGSAFMIDCVSLGFHYFGDYGRTVFVGEPTKTMKRATDCIAFGWDAVRDKLKPGVTYADIKRMGTEALKKAGYDFDVPFTPHSIGLSHTDEPGPGGSSTFWTKDNIVLEENMVLSIDMPIKASGIGGSAHLEDLTLITKDGAVQINDIGDRSFMV